MTVEVQKATGLEVTGLDIEPEALELAGQYAKECGIPDSRIHWACADVHSLPFPDNSFDLVVSRGSIPFWRDHRLAAREIMRVLRPGGVALVGGGSGRLMPKEEWEKIRPGAGTDKPIEQIFHFPFPMSDLAVAMTRAGIADYRLMTEGGTWVEFHKPPAN